MSRLAAPRISTKNLAVRIRTHVFPPPSLFYLLLLYILLTYTFRLVLTAFERNTFFGFFLFFLCVSFLSFLSSHKVIHKAFGFIKVKKKKTKAFSSSTHFTAFNLSADGAVAWRGWEGGWWQPSFVVISWLKYRRRGCVYVIAMTQAHDYLYGRMQEKTPSF